MRPHACLFMLLAVFSSFAAFAESASYPLEVLPAEWQTQTDPQTGAKLTFITTDPAQDNNLYFHDYSWTVDESLLLFTSARAKGDLMACITKTGELIRIHTPKGRLNGANAAVRRNNVIYALRGVEAVELTLKVDTSQKPAKVTATERLVCVLPKASSTTALAESSDGASLAIGRNGFENGGAAQILILDAATGAVKHRIYVPESPGYSGHVTWSRTNPNLLSFAGLNNRLQVIDARTERLWCPYVQAVDEMVTHGSWWVNDTMLFCGGTHPKPTEDAHIKQINPMTGEVRIIGEGAWWPEAKPIEIAKRNWWHASGSEDGFWVIGDNWHGDLMLFEGKTTRPHLLTAGHRTYGKGDHPHVGWDRKSQKVVFTSLKRGNSDVCVAEIPPAWRAPIPPDSKNNYPKPDQPKE